MLSDVTDVNALRNKVIDNLRILSGSCAGEPIAHYADNSTLPNMQDVEESIRDLANIAYTGIVCDRKVPINVSLTIKHLFLKLKVLVYGVLCCHDNFFCSQKSSYAGYANEVTVKVLEYLPEFVNEIKLDLEAAYAGDPAASSINKEARQNNLTDLIKRS